MASSTEHKDLSLFMLSQIAAQGRLGSDDYLRALEIATADGSLDEKERRILRRLLDLLPPADVPDEIKTRIDDLRLQYGA